MSIRDEFSVLFESIERDDSPIIYISKFRKFGLRVIERKTSLRENIFDHISFCPFTGKKLPNSLRDLWFEKLEDLGLEPNSPSIPQHMRTEEWWEDLP